MNLFFKALLILIYATQASANEPDDSYIEFSTIIINLQNIPGTEHITGYLLATPCSTCQPIRIEVERTTELRLNGDIATLKELGMKIDWQGTVFFQPGTPPVATRLMLQ